MNQEARTALGYCRLDALMAHQFIVHLWPLSLWHCQHLLFLSWNIFRFSYSYILVIIQLFKQHFPTMHLTDSFSPFFSFLASLAYFFILASSSLLCMGILLSAEIQEILLTLFPSLNVGIESNSLLFSLCLPCYKVIFHTCAMLWVLPFLLWRQGAQFLLLPTAGVFRLAAFYAHLLANYCSSANLQRSSSSRLSIHFLKATLKATASVWQNFT